MIENDSIFPSMFKSWKVTIFVPNDQAIKSFLERNSQQSDAFNSDLLKYHIGKFGLYWLDLFLLFNNLLESFWMIHA